MGLLYHLQIDCQRLGYLTTRQLLLPREQQLHTKRGPRDPSLRLRALPVEAQATERGLVIHGITLAPNAESKLQFVPSS
jgi:hypothetical protein